MIGILAAYYLGLGTAIGVWFSFEDDPLQPDGPWPIDGNLVVDVHLQRREILLAHVRR